MSDEPTDDDCFSYSPEGKLQYKIEKGKLWYDPEYHSYIKIGMKTKDNDEHWTEDFALDPKKKTVFIWGGDGTKTARAANGNINSSINALGFTDEQQNNMQMLACYYPENRYILEDVAYGDVTNFGELSMNDIQREVLRVYHPFIAEKTEQGWKKLPSNELLDNMRNILHCTHCRGTDEMGSIENIIQKEMLALGYEEALIDKALKQNLCITNNSQRQFDDNPKITTLHRYSVYDGQFESDDIYNITNSYPAHLAKSVEYNKFKGNKSSFIILGKNETLMVFDKILSNETESSNKDEHNQAFFTTNPECLSEVGKKQLKLMLSVAQGWYKKHNEMPSAEDLVRQCGQDAGLEVWTSKSFVAGKLLQKEHNNPLKNPHVLEVAKNRFNNPNIEPEHTGVWKLLRNVKQQRS